MTLYKKDGSVYKLSSPNPVMKTQNIWTDYILHNLDKTSKFKETLSNSNIVVKENSNNSELNQDLEETEEPEVSFLQELSNTKNEVKVKEVNEIKVNEIKDVIPETVKKPSLELIEKTFVYCLPAQIKSRKDDLYGDVYQTIKYDDPISLEAVLVSQNDLSLDLWTNFDGIHAGSIIYPKGSRRWWRVQNKTEKAEGWVLSCLPSDFQPAFENL